LQGCQLSRESTDDAPGTAADGELEACGDPPLHAARHPAIVAAAAATATGKTYLMD